LEICSENIFVVVADVDVVAAVTEVVAVGVAVVFIADVVVVVVVIAVVELKTIQKSIDTLPLFCIVYFVSLSIQIWTEG